MSDWGIYRLNDLADLYDSQRVPLSSKQRAGRQGVYPYYGASGVIDSIDGYLFDGEYVLIAEDGENLRSRKIPLAFKADGKFWVNNHAHILRGKEPWQNDLIVYLFRNTNISPYVTGAAQPKLNQENLLSIEFELPEQDECKHIVKILSSLDEKIELNHKQNRTLEAIAQALFKRWFVEFEFPDKNGQPYKSSGGAMQPSELGEIPVGWEVGQVGDVITNARETAEPTLVHGDTPYVGLEHIDRKSLGLSEWGAAGDVTSNKSRFRRGNILFGKLRPYFHKVAIAPCDGICSTDILVLQEKSQNCYCFMVLLAFSEEFVNYSNNASTGTRMPRASWKHMKEYLFALPPEELFGLFNEVIEPVFQKIQANISESRVLSNLRNNLLPKLMSGELRVGER